jgi:hypothetical protein
MGKGSAPRNCFSKQFQDNYESIDWSKQKHVEEVIDASIINGCGDDQPECVDESEEESCANE